MEPKTVADFENGNQLNIEEIIETYNGYVYTILKNGMSNQEDMEEILSDVFVIFWKNYERMDKEMKVKPYLMGITKNLVRKKYQTINFEKHFRNLEDCDNQISDEIDILYLIEENEKSKIIEETVENMKLQEQQIFMRFYYRSQKVKEISRELKISETKVKVTLHRLRKKIKKKLKERGYDYGKSGIK